MPPAPLHPRLDVPFALADLIIQAATEITRRSAKAYRIVRRRGRGGKALQPGRDTPLWNELRKQLLPHLKQYGNQANLGRVLGLPRQQINAFVAGSRMPDAERTLQLLAWLMAVRQNRKPA
ncbi:MAG: hypothetical protein KA257_07905 [Opitutaceae bacterium]|nr:hypothetical protein [Opitutaceae bacterium]MBP9914323.1 hypothetical protein [Opitutaceae bacterium]